MIKRIVKKESPIHYKHLKERIRECFDVSRLGKKIQRSIENTIHQIKDISIVKKGKIFWRKDQTSVPVRYPNGDRRRISKISIEEVAQGVLIVLRDSISCNIDDTILYTSRIFGYHSVSGKNRKHIKNAIQKLMDTKYIIRKVDKLKLKDETKYELRISLN